MQIEAVMDMLGKHEIQVKVVDGELKVESAAAIPRRVKLLIRKHYQALVKQITAAKTQPVGAGKSSAQLPPQQTLGTQVPNRQELASCCIQQVLWQTQQQDSLGYGFHRQVELRIAGKLNITLLTCSLTELIARRPILRTGFRHNSNGELIQSVAAPQVMDIREIEVGSAALSDSELEREVTRVSISEGRAAFDLTHGPLFRVCLLQLPHNQQRLLVSFHEMIMDARSWTLFFQELMALYASCVKDNAHRKSSPLPRLAFDIGDYIGWQQRWLQSQSYKRQLGYWRRKSQILKPALPLPYRQSRVSENSTPTPSTSTPGTPTLSGARVPVAIDEALTARLFDLRQRQQVSLYCVLLAALYLQLMRYCGRTDVIVGASNTQRQDPILWSVMGPLSRVVPLPFQLKKKGSVTELLQAIRPQLRQALETPPLPYDILNELVHGPATDLKNISEQDINAAVSQNAMASVNQWPGDLALDRFPLCQVLLDLKLSPFIDSSLDADTQIVSYPRLRDLGAAQHQIALCLDVVDNCIEGYLEYRTDLFAASTMQQWVQDFYKLLKLLVDDPEKSLEAVANEIPEAYETHKAYNSLDHQRHFVRNCNPRSFRNSHNCSDRVHGKNTKIFKKKKLTKADILKMSSPKTEHEGGVKNIMETAKSGYCVHHLFEQQVRKTPHAIAIKSGKLQVSYRELNRLSNQLAHHLNQYVITPDSRIGLYTERSLDMAIGLLGILKAGGAYVPLDPNYPKERLLARIEQAGVQLLLTHSDLLERMPSSRSIQGSGIQGSGIQGNRVQETGAQDGSHTSNGNTSCEVLCLDQRHQWLGDKLAGKNPISPAYTSNLAYVIFTPGTVAEQRAVAMPHGALVNLIRWQVANSAMALNNNTLQYSPLSFDTLFQELFSAWCSGGCATLMPEDLRKDSARLYRFIASEKIHRLFLPAKALQQLAETAMQKPDRQQLTIRKAPVLKEVITAGASLAMTPAMQQWFMQMPGCTLVNQYGPYETQVATSCVMAGPPENWAPTIGKPISNIRIYLLDKQLHPVAPGEYGTIYIGGEGLARGYLHRNELRDAAIVAERFITAPAGIPDRRLFKTAHLARYRDDGSIELKASEQQPGVSGYRVELDALESVLSEQPWLRQGMIKNQAEKPGHATAGIPS